MVMVICCVILYLWFIMFLIGDRIFKPTTKTFIDVIIEGFMIIFYICLGMTSEIGFTVFNIIFLIFITIYTIMDLWELYKLPKKE
jgi:hypothetical protein